MTWNGFMVISSDKDGNGAHLNTMRGCALQAYQAGLDAEIYKDSRDAAKKGKIIAYVEITRIDK